MNEHIRAAVKEEEQTSKTLDEYMKKYPEFEQKRIEKEKKRLAQQALEKAK